MRRGVAALFALFWGGAAAVGASAPEQRPNVVFILCDDLGYGDTGFSFQNRRAASGRPALSTPQLDRMAAGGIELRRHYAAAPVCAPSRASLLRGVPPGHAGVRDNQFDKALAEGPNLASVLKAAGYATAAFGKWGLHGGPEDARARRDAGWSGSPAEWAAYPTKRGFDHFLGYVRHRDGHHHYPHEDRVQVWENDREISGDLALCYTTDLFTAAAKAWVRENYYADPARPFFIFLSFDTPHAALQNPPCAYPEGGGLTGGVQWTGRAGAMLNTARGVYDGWMHPQIAAATWDHDPDPATTEVAWPEIQQRYANGVRRIDDAVGDLRQLLRDLGLAENTLVVFTSDNGPSPAAAEGFSPEFFRGYGPWDGVKRDLWEGGLREPTLVEWPARIAPGRQNDTPSGQWDWLATLAAVSGVPVPADSDGVSLLPTLTGRGTQRPSTLYFEYQQPGRTPDYADFAVRRRNQSRGQMQAVQLGDYKGVRYAISDPSVPFEIYDLTSDPAERHDLGGEPAFAELQRRMQATTLRVRRPDPAAPRPYDNLPIPALEILPKTVPGLRYTTYRGEWPWLPDLRTLNPQSIASVRKVGMQSGAPSKSFGAHWEGYLRVPRTGDYRFQLTTNGEATLFLHDSRVIAAGPGEIASVRLEAGWHPVRVGFRSGGPPPRLELLWAEGEDELEPIAPANLAYAPVESGGEDS